MLNRRDQKGRFRYEKYLRVWNYYVAEPHLTTNIWDRGSNDCLKSRMREIRTYGSVKGSRQAFHCIYLKGVPYGALLADVLLRSAQPVYLPRYFPQTAASGKPGTALKQYRIILSADTASKVRQMLSQKRR